MKWSVLISGGFITAYLILTVLIYFAQRRLLYFPPDSYLPPTAVNVAMEEIKNEAGDIVSWWSPPRDTTKKTVMVFHGNGSAIYSNSDIFNDLVKAGHGVLSVGYPGYPGRSGRPTQKGLVDAALTQYEWVIMQGITPQNIVFYGTSLGAGVAAQLTQHKEPRLLILDAPFNSVVEMAQSALWFIPVNLLMKDRYQSHLALKDKAVPLIWIHGTEDNVVPLSQGQKLFDSYKGPKSDHIIKGGQHINLWSLGGREIVLTALKD